MDFIVEFGERLNFVGIGLFCLLGYFNGFLFRNMGMYKIIIAIFSIPMSIQLLVSLNIVYDATIPFLLFAPIGYLGIGETSYRVQRLFSSFRRR